MENIELKRIKYLSSLFGDKSEKDYMTLNRIAASTDILDNIEKVYEWITDSEGKLYILFRLYLKRINPNYIEGISGIAISQDEYYQPKYYNEIDLSYTPAPTSVKTTRLSKKEHQKIYKNNRFIIDRSDKCYTKFLSYEKWEVTQNLAYEFSKRSEFPFAEFELFYLFKKILLRFLSSEYMADLKDDINQYHYIIMAIQDFDNFYDLVHFFTNESTSIDTIYEDMPTYTRTVKYFEKEEEYFNHVWQYYDKISNYELELRQQDIIRANFKNAILSESEIMTYTLRVNMALPEDEIIDYIKKVRKALLQDEKMESLNILKSIFGERDDYRTNVADMLFTYDALRIGMRYSHILDSITTYSMHSPYECTKDSRTLKRYFQYAKVLIEEKYYKALISPIYNAELLKKIETIKRDKKI
jgi:hypothetical protein